MDIEEEREAFEAWRDKQPTGIYADLASWLAAKRHAGVVLPGSRCQLPLDEYDNGWNACLDEITRLNGPKA